MSEQQQRPLKKHKTCDEQLELLTTRGLGVADSEAALRSLERLGYYRLSGYFYPLRKTKPIGERGRLDDFQEGATFELVMQLAEFDKKLRLLALDALEVIEVAVRVAVAHKLGKFAPDAHLMPQFLDGKFTQSKHAEPSKHADWIARFQVACDKSKDDFYKHHKMEYEGRMPIWVAAELWDFGLLSRFVSGMTHRDQAAIAQQCGAFDGVVLKSWMRTFNFVRNVAAHHSRLWNRTLPDIPSLPSLERCRWLEALHKDDRTTHKLFGALMCMRLLLKTIAPHKSWHTELRALAQTFPSNQILSLESAGFPTDWQEQPIWA